MFPNSKEFATKQTRGKKKYRGHKDLKLHSQIKYYKKWPLIQRDTIILEDIVIMVESQENLIFQHNCNGITCVKFSLHLLYLSYVKIKINR